jgi:hypothetical protein
LAASHALPDAVAHGQSRHHQGHAALAPATQPEHAVGAGQAEAEHDRVMGRGGRGRRPGPEPRAARRTEGMMQAMRSAATVPQHIDACLQQPTG